MYGLPVSASVNPGLIVRWLLALFCAGLGIHLTLQLLELSPAAPGTALPPDYPQTLVGSAPALWLGITAFIVVADLAYSRVQKRFVGGLDVLVKDIGQLISAGHGIESAVHHATTARRGQAARVLSRVLRSSTNSSFEESLLRAASATPDPGFREAALLLEQGVRAGGDAGKRVQETGEILSQVRAMQERFRASLSLGIGLIRTLGLLIVPALFSLLSVSTGFSIAPHGAAYFAAMVFGLGILEWRIARDLTRGLFRWPFFVALISFVLCTTGSLLESGPSIEAPF